MIKKNISIVKLYIQCNFKNTLISLTKLNGQLYKQWSTKALKKTELKKNNPYNIQLITNKINKYLYIKKLKHVYIFIKGNGIGRYYIIKNLNKKYLIIHNIIDNTFVPFNGCRNKKQKRR